jgi:hypothetical protein
VQQRCGRVTGKRRPSDPGHAHDLIGRHARPLANHEPDGNHGPGIAGTGGARQPLLGLSIIPQGALTSPKGKTQRSLGIG